MFPMLVFFVLILEMIKWDSLVLKWDMHIERGCVADQPQQSEHGCG
jgi:hypothetical protein